MVGNRVVAHHECDEGRSDEIAYGTTGTSPNDISSKRLLLDLMPSMSSGGLL